MTRIDAASQLAALIKAQLKTATGVRQPLRREGPKAGAGAPADPSATMLERVAAISVDDPQRRRKALRIFLESTLVEELGGSLAHDPRFQDMLDHVQGQFDKDLTLSRAADDAAAALFEQINARQTR